MITPNVKGKWFFFRVIFRGMWLKSHPCDNLRKSRRRAIFSFFFSFHDNLTRKRFLVIFQMADTSFHTQHIHTHAQTYIKCYKKFKILRTFFRCSLWNFLKFILIRGMKNTLEVYFMYQYSEFHHVFIRDNHQLNWFLFRSVLQILQNVLIIS